MSRHMGRRCTLALAIVLAIAPIGLGTSATTQVATPGSSVAFAGDAGSEFALLGASDIISVGVTCIGCQGQSCGDPNTCVPCGLCECRWCNGNFGCFPCLLLCPC